MQRKHHSLIRLGIVALAAALLAAACGDTGGGPGDGEGQVLALADVPRLDAEPGAAANAADAVNAFALDLYAELAQQDGNLVFSPHSVAIALAMTRTGAAGSTLDELTDVLYLGSLDDPDAAFNALDQALADRSGTFTRRDDSEAELTLEIANSLWGQQDTTFKDPFLEGLAGHYGAGLRLVDFKTDPEGARQVINEWVASQTRDRIEDLIPEDTLDALTRLVLTNAVYLLAPWEQVFEEGSTAPATFHRLDGTTTSADLMAQAAGLPYAAAAGWQAVELAYAGRDLSMLVIVPDEGSFADVEASFDSALLRTVVDRLESRQVNLRFPKFEFRTQTGLTTALRNLGVVDAFEPDVADFSGMTDDESLYISAVVHEAFIAVDEEGTEAAAATAVVVSATSAPLDPVELVVDRPFLFAIRDVPTGAVLFLGRVLDPTAG